MLGRESHGQETNGGASTRRQTTPVSLIGAGVKLNGHRRKRARCFAGAVINQPRLSAATKKIDAEGITIAEDNRTCTECVARFRKRGTRQSGAEIASGIDLLRTPRAVLFPFGEAQIVA